MIVVDASAALAWLFLEDDPHGWLAAHLPGPSLLTTAHWRLEVSNGILKKERKRDITPAQADRFLAVLDDLPITIHPPRSEQTLLQLARFARPHQLTTYDAVYLDLALTASASLLTLDKNLIDAAHRLGVAVVPATV